jgi:hypothetical protein
MADMLRMWTRPSVMPNMSERNPNQNKALLNSVLSSLRIFRMFGIHNQNKAVFPVSGFLAQNSL